MAAVGTVTTLGLHQKLRVDELIRKQRIVSIVELRSHFHGTGGGIDLAVIAATRPVASSFDVGAVVGEHFKGSAGLQLRQDVRRGHWPSDRAMPIAASRISSASTPSPIDRANTIPPTHSVAIARARDRAACPLRCIACSKIS